MALQQNTSVVLRGEIVKVLDAGSTAKIWRLRNGTQHYEVLVESSLLAANPKDVGDQVHIQALKQKRGFHAVSYRDLK